MSKDDSGSEVSTRIVIEFQTIIADLIQAVSDGKSAIEIKSMCVEVVNRHKPIIHQLKITLIKEMGGIDDESFTNSAT